jgi:plastocyanin
MLLTRFAALAALSFIVASPVTAQSPGVVVQVYSFGFGPKPIHLAAGKPVTLTFVNQSGSSHDFTAKTFFATSTVTAGAAPDGEIDLAPHQTRTITLIPRAGTYHAHCSHFFHAAMGMTDLIIVG